MNVQSYALLDLSGSPNTVRRLELAEPAQAVVEKLVRDAIPKFTDPELTRVKFDPTYKTDDESVLCIEGYELPEHYVDSLATPSEDVPKLEETARFRRAKALFHDNEEGQVVFQSARRFDLFRFDKKYFLCDGTTFVVDERPSLVIGDAADAVYDGERLLFNSTFTTGSFLPLGNHITEATSKDIEILVGSELFSGDATRIAESGTRTIKQKIRLLVMSESLKGFSIEDVLNIAEQTGYSLPVENGKIALPESNRELSDVLSFFTDKMYLGPFSGQTLVANSVRPA